ncbi:MAG TPA: hypothetical protein VFL07_02380 [Rudaea sp.]|nr:hypothetical protein [Rudaea sp.]HSC10915.1 hypothetical protein [Rhodanobacteraceae bacterium]
MHSAEVGFFGSRRPKGFASNLLAAVFLACALLYALSTFCAIMNFGLHQPMFDQYKEYGNYLTRPFLDSVIMIENGHRPVIPALIANIEILWFRADQALQLAIGTTCLFLTWALIAGTFWRQSDMPRMARAAGVMLAALGLFWLGNARMLLQGVTQLQAHMVVCFVTVAALCTWSAARRDSWSWIAAAAIACAAAMFTFGAGVAAFPTIIALGVLLRMRWQKLLAPASAALLCLYLYILVLPGHQGVQNSLSLRPVATLVIIAQWLSSPWANGLLALADPPLQPWLPGSFDTDLGHWLVTAANGLVAAINTPWRSITTVFGTLGITIFLLRLIAIYVRAKPVSRSEALANALCMFAFASAAIVAIGRLDYFQAAPDQVFADRYLVWPCLFWTGLAWLVVTDICRLKNRGVALVGLLFLVALPVVLYPTHRAWAGWGAAVYHISQQSAASVRSGVFDETLFPSGADASRDDVLHTLTLLKQGQLAMFAEPSWKLAGSQLHRPLSRSEEYGLDLHIDKLFRDSESGLAAARIEGAFLPNSTPLRADEQLALLDDEDRIVGLAESSFISWDATGLRLDIARRRGFSGYIRDYRNNRNYRLVLLQGADRAVLLKTIEPGPDLPAGEER